MALWSATTCAVLAFGIIALRRPVLSRTRRKNQLARAIEGQRVRNGRGS